MNEKYTEQTELPFVEGEYVEEQNNTWMSYTRLSLNELEDGDTYTGKPLLLPIEKVTFDDDGIEQIRHRCRLILVDEEAEEYLQINLNLKNDNDIQINIHNASSLYALIAGIMNLKNPQWTRMYNRIKQVNLEDWRKYLGDKERMRICIVEKQGNNFVYNSFRIMELI